MNSKQGSKQTIKKARHFRKMFGGGWRQAGVLAAACLYSLDHIFPLLRIDHQNATYLSKGLESIGFTTTRRCDTSMVWIDTKKFGLTCQDLADALEKHGIAVFGGQDHEMRFVLHHQISKEAIARTILVLKDLIKDKIVD